MVINTSNIALTTATTLSGVVSKINTAGITGVTASAANNKLNLFVTSAAASNGSTADGKVTLVDSLHSPLAAAGITAGTYYNPQVTRDTYVGVPSWRSTDTVAAPYGSVYIKTSVQGNGMNLAVKKYNNTAGSWATLAVPIYSTIADAIYSLDPAGGGNGIAAGTVIGRYTTSATSKLCGTRLFFRKEGTKTSVTGNTPTGSFTIGHSFNIQATVLGTSSYATTALSPEIGRAHV